MTGRLSAADREYLRRSCATSGVPEKVTDPATVARTAALVLNSESGHGGRVSQVTPERDVS